MKSRLLSALLFVVVSLAAAAAVWKLWPEAKGDSLASSGESPQSADDADLVKVPAEKIAAMGLVLGDVKLQSLTEEATVPGRVRYDDTRHVEIRAATAGVLIDVSVKPGDVVAAGDVVATLSSPEIAQARADVLQREANLSVAEELKDWKATACTGLQQLSAAVRKGRSFEDIGTTFDGTQLGSARQEILNAYSQLLLSRKVATSLESVSQSGAVPPRTISEAVSNRDKAAAAFEAILEQTEFDSRRACQEATNAAADAARRLQIARQHLRTLLGDVGEMPTTADNIDASSQLSHVEVRAPFAGTIEHKSFSATERVAQGDSLFVLADTSKLWISVDLREREWSAAELKPGDELQVAFAALPGERLTAKVYFVGREVDPLTNALPLIARIDNADRRLRPGMFAQITLPLGAAREVLAVPESAVLEHQGEAFVFRPEGRDQFRRVHVEPGLRSGRKIEIKSGLAKGDAVVVSGGFLLKSELLLEQEAE